MLAEFVSIYDIYMKEPHVIFSGKKMYFFTEDRFCLSKQRILWSNAASGSAMFANIRI